MTVLTPTPETPVAEDEEEVFLQIGYASAGAVDFAEEDLVELLAEARIKNQERGITGMLLYHEGSFLQVLEGPAEAVETLYKHIGMDKRHSDSILLFKREIDHRQFDNWTMGFHRVSKDKAKRPAGLNQFLSTGVTTMTDRDAEKVRNVLLGFREGRWHRLVSHWPARGRRFGRTCS